MTYVKYRVKLQAVDNVEWLVDWQAETLMDILSSIGLMYPECLIVSAEYLEHIYLPDDDED